MTRPAVSVAAPVVDAVEAAAYTIPTDAPEGDGTLTWDSSTLVLVHVRSGDTTGLGWTYGAAATVQVVEQQLATLVAGHSAWDVPAANEAMSRAVRNAGRPGLVAGAISAVDVALWDLKARLLGLPLVRLLGASRSDVPVYGSGGFTPYDDVRQDRQLRTWVEEQGIPRVKIKIGESWGQAEERDQDRIARARRSIGARTELYVDANGAYTRKQAVRLGGFLTEQGVTWLEEPVSSDDLTGLAQIRAAVTADVAAGEYGYSLPYFRQLLDAGAVDCPQADATRCGGITVWLRVAALAEAAGLQISGHCGPARPRTRGGRRAQPAPPGVVPRPRTHRTAPFRRDSGPGGRGDQARGSGHPGAGSHLPYRSRRTLSGMTRQPSRPERRTCDPPAHGAAR